MGTDGPAALDFLQKLAGDPRTFRLRATGARSCSLLRRPFATKSRPTATEMLSCHSTRRPKLRLLLAGHCDQIGLLVSYIDADGFLYAQTIGGWDPQQLVGQRMTIWTRPGPCRP